MMRAVMLLANGHGGPSWRNCDPAATRPLRMALRVAELIVGPHRLGLGFAALGFPARGATPLRGATAGTPPGAGCLQGSRRPPRRLHLAVAASHDPGSHGARGLCPELSQACDRLFLAGKMVAKLSGTDLNHLLALPQFPHHRLPCQACLRSSHPCLQPRAPHLSRHDPCLRG